MIITVYSILRTAVVVRLCTSSQGFSGRVSIYYNNMCTLYVYQYFIYVINRVCISMQNALFCRFSRIVHSQVRNSFHVTQYTSKVELLFSIFDVFLFLKHFLLVFYGNCINIGIVHIVLTHCTCFQCKLGNSKYFIKKYMFS